MESQRMGKLGVVGSPRLGQSVTLFDTSGGRHLRLLNISGML